MLKGAHITCPSWGYFLVETAADHNHLKMLVVTQDFECETTPSSQYTS